MTFDKPSAIRIENPISLEEYRKLTPLDRKYEGIIGWKERTYTDWRNQMIHLLPLLRHRQTEIIVHIFMGELIR